MGVEPGTHIMRQFAIYHSALLVAVVLLVSACELDSRADSDYEMLRGEWQVEHLAAEGESQTGVLNNRYSGDVTFTFTEDGSTGNRSMSMYGNRQGDSDLDLQSSLTLTSGNSFMISIPDTSGTSDFIIGYDFDDSDQVVLTANPPYGYGLLSELLGSSQYVDPTVQVTLERAGVDTTE